MVAALFVHIGKLWGGTFIPEASAHMVALHPTAAHSIENVDKSIVINGKDGSIVGQMAKIQPETDQLTGIKSMTEVDNRASRDLLSVVNKY